MGLTDAPAKYNPDTLGATDVRFRTRAKPEPLFTIKKKAGKPVFTDPVTQKDTLKSETVVEDPVSGTILKRYQHEPVMEPVMDGNKQAMDYVQDLSLTQFLIDSTTGANAGRREGGEADLSPALRKKWADLIVETREEIAKAMGMKPFVT